MTVAHHAIGGSLADRASADRDVKPVPNRALLQTISVRTAHLANSKVQSVLPALLAHNATLIYNAILVNTEQDVVHLQALLQTMRV